MFDLWFVSRKRRASRLFSDLIQIDLNLQLRL